MPAEHSVTEHTPWEDGGDMLTPAGFSEVMDARGETVACVLPQFLPLVKATPELLSAVTNLVSFAAVFEARGVEMSLDLQRIFNEALDEGSAAIAKATGQAVAQ